MKQMKSADCACVGAICALPNKKQQRPSKDGAFCANSNQMVLQEVRRRAACWRTVLRGDACVRGPEYRFAVLQLPECLRGLESPEQHCPVIVEQGCCIAATRMDRIPVLHSVLDGIILRVAIAPSRRPSAGSTVSDMHTPRLMKLTLPTGIAGTEINPDSKIPNKAIQL